MSIDTQLLSFLIMSVVGIYLGCMFDTNERIVKAIKEKKLLCLPFQFMFWLAQGFIAFYILVKINGGQVHLYFILSLVAGFLLYNLLFRRLYQQLLEGMITLVKYIVRLISQLVYFILIKPIMLLYKLIMFILGLILAAVNGLIRLILRLITWFFKCIWALLPKNTKKYLVSIAGLYSKIENIIVKRFKR
ncbi:spore cortex biosynthesis protein YabQ [Amphibacillus sediminis]|uniref:spore cortex biosynthesis protein YabQ n=1 Tax=Amphibacillus sediminis TaxID=360185 RepID=UPI000832C4C4|nr:spore cortex biosynthesis protein YabQ [Amphibacillus sediminis]